ncbi:MAG TPA: alpha/beta hydrolase [Caldilineaceae bacterium]|nr:alpha/beta hydrolase [Caldilineaceae bacterium]
MMDVPVLQHSDLQTPRLRFHLRRRGDADGLPMLLLHGSFASGRWWEPFLSILPTAILAVAPDLRGCGASDKPDGGYAIEEQAEDVWALVQALQWDEFDLVGHASGGAIAVEYALRHPTTVRTLALVDSAPVEGVFSPLETLRLLEQMRTDRELLAQALAVLMPTFPGSASDGSPDERAFFQQLVSDAQAMAPAAFTAVAEALARWNRFGDARRLTMPALVLWGDQDVVVDRDAMTRTLIAIPGAANMEVLRGVGHSPMIEAPVRLAERLIDFITDDFDDFDEVRRQAQ